MRATQKTTVTNHTYRLWAIVGNACVWVALWLLLEVCFKSMSESVQILAYLAVLALGLKILHRVSKEGFLI
jgi:hypothetical protein